MIYFIRNCKDNLVKIGYAQDPQKRLRQLQTGSSAELSLLFEMEGDQAFEKRLHDWLKARRIRGEWFQPSPGLADFLCRQALDQMSINLDPVQISILIDQTLGLPSDPSDYLNMMDEDIFFGIVKDGAWYGRYRAIMLGQIKPPKKLQGFEAILGLFCETRSCK